MLLSETQLGHKLSHPDFWHGLMFYTTGELVRRQVPELVPYAIKYGMWETNWPNFLPVLEEDWKQFLDGHGTFRGSMDRVVADSN